MTRIRSGWGTQVDWQQLLSDHDLFCRVLAQLFHTRGYTVLEWRVFHDPLEEQARECGLLLERGGELCVVLGLRQDLVVTSDVVGRLGRAVRVARASAGFLLTTSFFTEAAIEAARAWPIQLYDHQRLWELLALR